MNTSLEQAVDWLRQQHDTMVAQLITLADMNSHSENVPGLQSVAEELRQMFEPLGVPCRTQELLPRQIVSDSGEVLEKATGPALLWHERAQASNRILLAIHYDTVYPVDHSFQKCQWLDDVRLRGPGVADAKGGIIVMLWALRAAEKFQLLPKLGWTVVLNPDEEIGSPSSWPLWQTIASAYNYGLLMEPALPDGALVKQRKGSGSFTIVMRGRAAHSGRNFRDGRNAVAKLAEMALEIHRWNELDPGIIVNIGKFVGGQAANVVPDVATLRLNIRIDDFSQQEQILSRLNRLVESYNTNEGYRCSLTGCFHAPPKLVCPKTELLMRQIEAAAAQQGQNVRFTATGGASDGNKLAAVGLPNIDTLGPSGDRLHSPEEWVDTKSLVENSERLLRVLVLLQAPAE